jgi:hypothetical protein
MILEKPLGPASGMTFEKLLGVSIGLIAGLSCRGAGVIPAGVLALPATP